MNEKNFLNYIEDKTIDINNEWFFHAAKENLIIIEKILNEGIKCSYLRNENSKKGAMENIAFLIAKKRKSAYNDRVGFRRFWGT